MSSSQAAKVEGESQGAGKKVCAKKARKLLLRY